MTVKCVSLLGYVMERILYLIHKSIICYFLSAAHKIKFGFFSFVWKLKYPVGRSTTTSEAIIHHCSLCIACFMQHLFCFFVMLHWSPKDKFMFLCLLFSKKNLNGLRDKVWYLASLTHSFIPNYTARLERKYGMSAYIRACQKLLQIHNDWIINPIILLAFR